MQIANNLQTSGITVDLNAQLRPKAYTAPVRGEDQVNISSAASKLSQLQASYDAGTYNVPPWQIANSILNDAML